MNSNASYHLEHLTKRYSASFELAIDALEIPAHQVIALVGPTGAGKSTLLKLLAGLESPSKGTITFNGNRFEADTLPLTTQRRITMVHQRPMLLSGSVQMNIEYGLRLRNRLDRNKVLHLMEQLNLTSIANQSAKTLSGGQTQLVAIARALILEPDVLLLDEPTANLDPARVQLVEQAVQEVFEKTNMTVIWATHHLLQAKRVSEQVIFLLDGKLVESSPTEKFFAAPDDPRSVDFVQGKMIY